MIVRRVDRKPRRLGIEMQRGDTRLIVEPLILEHDIGRTENLARTGASAPTPLAAHLEQIGEIVVKQQRQVEARRPVTVILQLDALVEGTAPQKARTHDV